MKDPLLCSSVFHSISYLPTSSLLYFAFEWNEMFFSSFKKYHKGKTLTNNFQQKPLEVNAYLSAEQKLTLICIFNTCSNLISAETGTFTLWSWNHSSDAVNQDHYPTRVFYTELWLRVWITYIKPEHFSSSQTSLNSSGAKTFSVI